MHLAFIARVGHVLSQSEPSLKKMRKDRSFLITLALSIQFLLSKWKKKKEESNDISWLKLFLKDCKGGSVKDTDSNGNKTKT